jgi:hypothetical protein
VLKRKANASLPRTVLSPTVLHNLKHHFSNNSSMAWKEDKEEITQRHFQAINNNNLKLFEIIKENLTEVQPILPLIEFVISRLETVVTLIMDNRIWDAEIILRSALETFVKFLFITTANKEEQEIRIHEFWNSLAEINSLKQSNQAQRNLKYFGHSELHRTAYSPMILFKKIETELRAKWTKPERRKIEQKWSFSEMIFSISKQYEGKGLEMVLALSYSYRMSSHVSHGDEMGILIIKERESRTKEEYEIAMAAHYCRLLSDCLSYCAFLGIETMNFLNLPLKRKFFFDNQKSLDDMQNIILKYHNKLFEDEIEKQKLAE